MGQRKRRQGQRTNEKRAKEKMTRAKEKMPRAKERQRANTRTVWRKLFNNWNNSRFETRTSLSDLVLDPMNVNVRY